LPRSSRTGTLTWVLSEQDLIATAAGLAIAGKTPVAAAFAVFLMRGWEQIRNLAARDRLNVKLIGTHAGLSPHMDGSSHQSLEDIALMRSIPGMTVVVPADAYSTFQLTVKAVKGHRGPLYMRLGRDNAPAVYRGDEELRIGGSTVPREGCDVTIMACGSSVGLALETARLLERTGIEAEVIDLYTVKPLDVRTVAGSVRKTGVAVTIESHNVVGGLGSAVAEVITDYAPARLVRLGVAERFGESARSYRELLEYFRLTPRWLAKKVLEMVRRDA